MDARDSTTLGSLVSLSFHRLRRQQSFPGFQLRNSDRWNFSVFRSGRNIWQKHAAKKVSFLVDADAFFRAFVEAALRAERQIIILGWDIDSRMQLPMPEGFISDKGQVSSLSLGEFFVHLTAKKAELEIYVLSWDFAFIYTFEREQLPRIKFGLLGSERIHFMLDREHPTCASHHQKVVVVDDQVAFSGGLDLTQRRWDTNEHRASDPRRVDPEGHSYGPFHDVQIAVEGDVARTLGELARERWKLATGEMLQAPQKFRRATSRWPKTAEVHIENVDIAIARTLPMGYYRDKKLMSPPVKEVERLFLDTIRRAQRFIYIENQYFTSPMIARAIARRLRERNGPEVVLVLPRDQTGWIEEGTMGLLRSRALQIVEDADVCKRFRAYHPVVPDMTAGYLKVHSKVMIVDDAFVRIGSANMNNRSLGLDTECDLAFEAGDRIDARIAIGRLRRELLGEHLGVEPAEFEARFLLNGSLIDTVESFRTGERTLVEIHPNVPEWVGHVLPPGEWIDPTGPKGIRRWFAKRLHLHRHQIGSSLVMVSALALLVLSWLESHGHSPRWLQTFARPGEVLQETWNWLRSWNADQIAEAIRNFRAEPWAIPAVLFGFVFLSLLFVPVTGMIIGIALTFKPAEAFCLALGGSLLASLTMYGIGRYWAGTKRKFFTRPIIHKISESLRSGGIWAIAIVRMTPIAPFTLVCLVAGSLKVRFRDYVIGSIIGLTPGIFLITLFSKSAGEFALQKNWPAVVAALLAMSLLGAFIPRGVRRLRSRISAFAFLIYFLPSIAFGEGILPLFQPGFAKTPEGLRFESVCPTIKVDQKKNLDFTAMEVRLMCGDPEPSAIGKPWARIPPNQAAYFLRGFLQARGRHVPVFIQDGDILFVRIGPQSELKSFQIVGGPVNWDPPKRRLIYGTSMTPSLLDDLQGWTLLQVKNEGYPCATAEARADPITGASVVSLTPENLRFITTIQNTGDTGLRDGVLDRYNAFRLGDTYRDELISLTRKRIQEDGFLQTLVLSPKCDDVGNGVTILRDVILGPSRTIRVGAGASTDIGARFRAIFRQNRLGDSASSAQLRLNTSYMNESVNHQVVDANYRWYWAPGEPRWYIEPSITFEHEEVPAYELQSFEGKALHAWGFELITGQLELRAGPTYLTTFQSRGLGPERTAVIYAEGNARWVSHDFEIHATSPREGNYVDLTALLTKQSWGANFTAQKLQLQGQKLWNLYRYDPPFFIIATRFNLSSVFSDDTRISSDLPLRFLTFLGGDENLRGFDRQSLPRSGVGALSGATGSVEGRLHRVILRRADVFAFLDAGMLGGAGFKLDRPVFLSPGVGLRWESAIGVLRGFVAQRFAAEELATEASYGRDWRLGFTYGEEF